MNYQDTEIDKEVSPTELAAQAAQVIAERTGVPRHDIALVLGSGWGQAADLIGEVVAEVPAAEIPGFHAPAVAGQFGALADVDGAVRDAVGRIGVTGGDSA